MAGGKYLLKNAVYSSCQVLRELGGKLVNHLFALSVGEKGKRINLIASDYTPFILNVEQYSKNQVMCPIGTFCDNLLNWEF